MHIDTDFNGGNALINRIEGDDIYFQPNCQDTEATWFYWNFRVKEAAGRRLRFHPSLENMITRHAPAISLDGGRHWQWLNPESVQADKSFAVQVPEGVDDLRVSMAMPYVQEDLEAFADRHTGALRISELCRSAKGSRIPFWQLGPVPKTARHRLFLSARHHCCEMMANYVLEGLLDAALAGDELGVWWKNNVSITVVPFVDYDGVAAGDQGKGRRPRDHNRDYDDHPIHRETSAMKDLFLSVAASGIDAVLDLHCPWLWGPGNEELFLVYPPGESMREHQQAFSRILQSAITGPLPCDPKDDVPFGEKWNVPDTYKLGCSFATWASRQKDTGLCAVLEVPYAMVHDQIITPANARLFGRDMASALRTYLMNSGSRQAD